MIYNSIIDLIGKTNIVKLNYFSKISQNNLYAKLESSNPYGSIKDRVAYEMITSALKSNKINKDTLIIESTSGNTGIGLAGVCLHYGLKLIITMPENMSKERIDLMEALNATVILTNKELGMQGAIDKAKELHTKEKNSFIPSQFTNSDNVLAHLHTTGPEIVSDFQNNHLELDIFCASIGTGGTITGTGKYLKKYYQNIKIIGVEPEESSIINGNPKGKHGIEGIGAGFIPEILDLSILNDTMMVNTNESKDTCHLLLTKEAIFSGISSGACLKGALKYLKKNKLQNKNVLLIFPDSGQKYLSVMKETK